MQVCAADVEKNSALLPMFFYFVFFQERVSAASAGVHGGL